MARGFRHVGPKGGIGPKRPKKSAQQRKEGRLMRGSFGVGCPHVWVRRPSDGKTVCRRCLSLFGS